MRRKSAETRQQIIDAAYTLFYQIGFIRTGVDAIANAAGITKRTLYQHFSSKDELIEVVLEHQQRGRGDPGPIYPPGRGREARHRDRQERGRLFYAQLRRGREGERRMGNP